MAKKRTLDRRTLREQAEAAEVKDKEKDEVEEEEEEEVDEEDAGDDDGGDDDEGGAKKKKKSKAKAKPVKKVAAVKKPAAKRSRAAKEVRLRAVWVVFDNSSKRVETFSYNQKKEAEALLEKKLIDKPSFYLSLVKEPFEE
ncbi:MAG TPA: hypothetical protein VGJ05_01170 [Fimbriiglobus sp.]|jgi:hypothetical protein